VQGDAAEHATALGIDDFGAEEGHGFSPFDTTVHL
jgi:hypothetical protein